MKYDKPLIILGPARSGTTILTTILRSHPQVFLFSDTMLYWNYSITRDIIRDVFDDSYHSRIEDARERLGIDLLDDKRKPQVSRALRRFHDDVDKLWEDILIPSEIVYGDKTPDYIEIIGELHIKYPNAKYIMCIRDPRDVWLSQVRHYTKRRRPWWAEPNIESAISGSSGMNVIHRLNQWTDHKDVVNHIEVRYEDMCECGEETLQGIADFLCISYRELLQSYNNCFVPTHKGQWKQTNIRWDKVIPYNHKQTMKQYHYYEGIQ